MLEQVEVHEELLLLLLLPDEQVDSPFEEAGESGTSWSYSALSSSYSHASPSPMGESSSQT